MTIQEFNIRAAVQTAIESMLDPKNEEKSERAAKFMLLARRDEAKAAYDKLMSTATPG